MKRVMVFGTFDMLHKGHINFLEQAKKCGDELVVVVARNSNVKEIKGAEPLHNMEERIESVKGLKIADKVIAGKKGNYFDIVWEESPDLICLGYDQESRGIEKAIKDKIGNESKSKEIGVIRLKPYKADKYKTTLLRDYKLKRL